MQTEFGWLIGDPHLGRKFEVGVPAHRKGEREAEQMQQFIDELATPGDMVVMVGDLFDHPYVPHTVVKAAIDAVLAAAHARPDTMFVFIAGNHDMPRKITATGAFDVFQKACSHRRPNLVVLTEPTIVNHVAFFPWEWDVPALDQVKSINRGGSNVKAAVGHWDLASFGGEDLHLAPVAALRHAFGEVPLFSGHVHTPGTYTIDGVDVVSTGSLQPFTHGEDPEGLIYVTVDLRDLDTIDTRNKCVRVRLRAGEQLPDSLDARSVVGQRIASEAAPDAGQAIALDKFDWAGIVKTKLAPLDPEVRGFIEERLPGYGGSQ